MITREQARVHVRWMIRRDMLEVLAIEKYSFDTPWTEEDFLAILRYRNCIGMVSGVGDTVVGYMLYELHKRRLDILNFAVHPEWRRRGVATQMVDKLVSKLSSHRRTSILVHVADNNLTGQLFFRSAGFRAIRVERDYYDEPKRDAYLMRYHLGVQS